MSFQCKQHFTDDQSKFYLINNNFFPFKVFEAFWRCLSNSVIGTLKNLVEIYSHCLLNTQIRLFVVRFLGHSVWILQSYIRWCYDDASSNFNCSRSILWNFGYVNVSAIDAKNALKTIGPFVTLFDSKDSLVSAHVRCHDVAPPLFLRFQCINIFANLV